MTGDDNYSHVNRDNLRQPIQMQWPKKQETFSQFFSWFLKSTLKFEKLQKKMILIADVFPNIADVFPKLLTPKNEVG